MKLKNELYKGYELEQKEEEQQRKLREKHDLDENVKVVEKPMLGKFFINTLLNIVVWLARILLVFLALVGIISLLYPSIRSELFNVVHSIFSQTKSMIGL